MNDNVKVLIISSVAEENCLNNVGACKIAQYKYIPSAVLMRVSSGTLFSLCVLCVHFPRSDCLKAEAANWRGTRRPASSAAPGRACPAARGVGRGAGGGTGPAARPLLAPASEKLPAVFPKRGFMKVLAASASSFASQGWDGFKIE